MFAKGTSVRLGMNVVFIEWLDSHERPGWTTEPPIAKPLVCFTVGFLVAETAEVVVVSGSITDEDERQRCGDMTIPKKVIRKRTILRRLGKAE